MKKKAIIGATVGGVGAFYFTPEIRSRLTNSTTGEVPTWQSWQVGIGGAVLGGLIGWML